MSNFVHQTLAANSVILTVKRLNERIKYDFEDTYSLIKVKGEVTEVTVSNSGHRYFNLSEESYSIRAVIFSYNAKYSLKELTPGASVIVKAKLTSFKNTNVILNVISFEVAEADGDIHKQIKDLRVKLKKLGMFDLKHKLKVPYFCYKIGVITSHGGDTIHDIKRVIKRQNPFCVIDSYDVGVQGINASLQVIKGIEYFNEIDVAPEVIIITRGGGAFDDLKVFSDEKLLHSVFKSKLPIVSAIGHAKDNPIIDDIADFSAATASDAAHRVVSHNIEHLLSNQLTILEKHHKSILQGISDNLHKVNILKHDMLNFSKRYIKECSIYINNIINFEYLNQSINRQQQMLDSYAVKIEYLLPEYIIKKTHSIDKQQHALTKCINNLQINLISYKSNINNCYYDLISLATQKFYNLYNHLVISENKLNSYKLDNILQKGVGIIYSEDNSIITKVNDLKPNQKYNLVMQDGSKFFKILP